MFAYEESLWKSTSKEDCEGVKQTEDNIEAHFVVSDHIEKLQFWIWLFCSNKLNIMFNVRCRDIYRLGQL